jgi:hypothetical protein
MTTANSARSIRRRRSRIEGKKLPFLELWYLQADITRFGCKHPVAVAVALGCPALTALIAAGTDVSSGLSLDQGLQDHCGPRRCRHLLGSPQAAQIRQTGSGLPGCSSFARLVISSSQRSPGGPTQVVDPPGFYTTWWDVNEPDAPQVTEGVVGCPSVSHHPGDDRSDAPPGDAHQLAHRRLRGMDDQPGHLVVEVLPVAGTVSGPGHLGDRRTVLGAVDPGRIGLQEALERPEIERPPVAPALALVIARGSCPAPPAAALAGRLGRTWTTTVSDSSSKSTSSITVAQSTPSARRHTLPPSTPSSSLSFRTVETARN